MAVYNSEQQRLVVTHFEQASSVLGPYPEPLSQSVELKTAADPILFSLPPTKAGTTPIACATASDTALILVTVDPGSPTPINLTVQHTKPLPVASPPEHIIPVDPMSWKPDASQSTNTAAAPYPQYETSRDAFVSISPEGELSFWAAVPAAEKQLLDTPGWKLTGRVHTLRRKIARAQCSSAKKTVLVVNMQEGQEITIWDSTESEFSSGLEYRQIYE